MDKRGQTIILYAHIDLVSPKVSFLGALLPLANSRSRWGKSWQSWRETWILQHGRTSRTCVYSAFKHWHIFYIPHSCICIIYVICTHTTVTHTHATSCINGSWIGVRNSADGAMHSKKRYNKLISCCMQAFHSSHACIYIYIYIYIHPYTYLYCNVSDLWVQ